MRPKSFGRDCHGEMRLRWFRLEANPKAVAFIQIQKEAMEGF